MSNHKISVTIDAARGLRAADVTGTSDPFAEVYIGDHRGKRRMRGHVQKTATVKHTLNPRWNETFTFTVNDREVSSSSLVVKLLDWDRFTRNDKLGYFVTSVAKVMATPYQDNWFPLVKNLRSNLPEQGQLHLIISVDGKGPSAKPAAQAPAQPIGAAAPYQPPYGAQPAYMGGGQQQPPYMGGGQQQPPYMGGGQPMMQPPMQQQPQADKYPGLGTAGSSFAAPSPAQAYPPPAGMPGYQQPPQQPMAQAPGRYGGQPPMGGAPGYAQSGAYPVGQQQQPPAAGYPPQAAAPPFGLQPQNVAQTGLAVPAAYIPSVRPPQ
ncbi:C2 domain containing protein [Acanthamoeba castellanii str. Neff]|uniref:C2 domain containing protein n=1 Tax=Acanthamoeba castellanii (strain ATCC 30010 / Neff) TaxID=1257118 RepID=L8HFT4_ACACF|nr:C2 domain containing protein [Acanthamoeba castellanii str. Neff]ELR24092.1 C2 domain containing protein [Acanthamoeba castellanii str. Neff]